MEAKSFSLSIFDVSVRLIAALCESVCDVVVDASPFLSPARSRSIEMNEFEMELITGNEIGYLKQSHNPIKCTSLRLVS